MNPADLLTGMQTEAARLARLPQTDSWAVDTATATAGRALLDAVDAYSAFITARDAARAFKEKYP